MMAAYDGGGLVLGALLFVPAVSEIGLGPEWLIPPGAGGGLMAPVGAPRPAARDPRAVTLGGAGIREVRIRGPPGRG